MTVAFESVTLHTSWRGIVSSAAGAVILLAVGVLVVAAVGFRVLPTLMLVAGVVATLVLAVALGGAWPSGAELAGAAMIVLAIAVLSLGPRLRPKRDP